MSYLATFDASAPEDRFALVRNWLDSAALPFVTELQARRPVLETPVCTLVAKFQDVVEILRQPSVFTVDLYKPMMGDYMLAQDETAIHEREKSIMLSMLNWNDIPAVRIALRGEADRIVATAKGRLDVVPHLTRYLPAWLVSTYFGLAGIPLDKLIDWSYWNQYDSFHNQPFDIVPDRAAITANRERAVGEMRGALAGLVQRRYAEIKAGTAPDDIVCRLLRTAYPPQVGFPIERLVLNIGGLLIGAVETTSQAATQALRGLLRRPDALAEAQQAALAGSDAVLDAYVYEALRFDPISPYLFRHCVRDTVIAVGTPRETRIAAGTHVLPLILSAMVDPDNVADPLSFAPFRPPYLGFHFGWGLHQCLGLQVGKVLIPELVRALIIKPGLVAYDDIDFAGTPFPQHYQVGWAD